MNDIIRGILVAVMIAMFITVGSVVAKADARIAKPSQSVHIELICVVDKVKYYDNARQKEIEVDLNLANAQKFHIKQLVIDADLNINTINNRNELVLFGKKCYNYIGDDETGDFAVFEDSRSKRKIYLDEFLKNMIYENRSNNVYLKCAPIKISKN